MDNYDIAIIGSGPCGYTAAIRAAQNGMKVCIFEKDRLGGVCLNWGCIPVKALFASSVSLCNVKRSSEFGIDIDSYALNYSKIYERKEGVVKKLGAGIETLFKGRKIEVIREKAEIKDSTHITAGPKEIEAKNLLIASGSVPFEIPGISFDGKHILSSSDMLELNELPKSVLIVGGGFIGCEFASILNAFGVEITIVEMMGSLLPSEDEEIAKKLEQIFRKKGIKVLTGTKVEKIEKEDTAAAAILSDGRTVVSERVLVAVGRSPNTKGLGIEALEIISEKGWIKVDRSFRTNIKNIYAAGDVTGGYLLAHVASREGIAAVENICGKDEAIDYNVIPSAIFTHPEIASVGLNERSAKGRNISIKARKFLFSAIGKSHVDGNTEGFIKLVVDAGSDKILGAQIIGAHATELIAEISPCVQFGITSEKLAGVIHAHPTLSEAIQEVSEAIHGKAIHSL